MASLVPGPIMSSLIHRTRRLNSHASTRAVEAISSVQATVTSLFRPGPELARPRSTVSELCENHWATWEIISRGRVQRWGDPVDEIVQGDVVWIPPGEKHWHGAAPNASMSHIALVEQLEGKEVEWMEQVSDTQYGAAVRSRAARSTEPAGTAASTGGQQSAAQQLMGDINPKLAELTDEVLFGDVWERSELTKRDRSLVTVAA